MFSLGCRPLFQYAWSRWMISQSMLLLLPEFKPKSNEEIMVRMKLKFKVPQSLRNWDFWFKRKSYSVRKCGDYSRWTLQLLDGWMKSQAVADWPSQCGWQTERGFAGTETAGTPREPLPGLAVTPGTHEERQYLKHNHTKVMMTTDLYCRMLVWIPGFCAGLVLKVTCY